jgi:virginiamycin B lyase
LWYTNGSGINEGEFGSIGRVTTTGTFSDYSDLNISEPGEITAGPDGALWFTSVENDSIGRLTTSGEFTLIPNSKAEVPVAITNGPDDALWFTDFEGGSIGRFSPSLFGQVAPDAGASGVSVSVKGSGFSQGEEVKASYQTGLSPPDPSSVTLCTGVADAKGKFSCDGNIPTGTDAGAAGLHVLVYAGQFSTKENVSFHTFR